MLPRRIIVTVCNNSKRLVYALDAESLAVVSKKKKCIIPPDYKVLRESGATFALKESKSGTRR